MSTYDYAKLYGRMREKGYTQAGLAKEIGISETSMNLTLNNKRDFRQNEILKISEVLEIPAENLEEYFFAKKL